MSKASYPPKKQGEYIKGDYVLYTPPKSWSREGRVIDTVDCFVMVDTDQGLLTLRKDNPALYHSEQS